MDEQEMDPILEGEAYSSYKKRLSKFERIQQELSCDRMHWLAKLHRIAGVAGVNMTKTASSLILYQAIIANDFYGNISYRYGWYITAGLLLASPVTLLSRLIYYFCSPSEYNPIRHTDNLIETLEIGAFSYGLLASIVRQVNPDAIATPLSKCGLLLAALGMIVLRNFDPDVVVWRQRALGHKLPAIFTRSQQPSSSGYNASYFDWVVSLIKGQQDDENPLFPSVSSTRPTDSRRKRIMRYVLRSFQMLIPPTILGDTMFRIITFGTGRTHNKIAAICSGCYACEHLLARSFDVRIAQGKPMRDLKQDSCYRWTRSDSVMAAFFLALIQSYYVLGDFVNLCRFWAIGESEFDSLDEDNLPWSLVVIYGFAVVLACYAAYDNANMYEQFFARQDKLAICRQYCQSDWEPSKQDLQAFWLERVEQKPLSAIDKRVDKQKYSETAIIDTNDDEIEQADAACSLA